MQSIVGQLPKFLKKVNLVVQLADFSDKELKGIEATLMPVRREMALSRLLNREIRATS
jgi:hypothetical protein